MISFSHAVWCLIFYTENCLPGISSKNIFFYEMFEGLCTWQKKRLICFHCPELWKWFGHCVNPSVLKRQVPTIVSHSKYHSSYVAWLPILIRGQLFWSHKLYSQRNFTLIVSPIPLLLIANYSATFNPKSSFESAQFSRKC